LTRSFDAPGHLVFSTTRLFASREARDLVIASPMARGVAEGYERLDGVLAAQGLRGS
jgi:hypothetical protein